MLAIFCEDIALCTPDFVVCALLNGLVHEKKIDCAEILNVDVVPSCLSLADHGDVVLLEDETGELVCLSASCCHGTTTSSWQ